jgi:hypothetical protein
MLTEEKLDGIGARPELSPWTFLRHLALEAEL